MFLLYLLFKDYFSHKSFLFLLLSLTSMEACYLVSTSRVLCTADSAFYCMLNYDGHILGCKTLIATWYWRPCACQFSSVQFSPVTRSCLTLCDPMNRSMPGLPVHHKLQVSSLLLHVQDLWLPLIFALTVNPSCRGHSHEGMSHSTQDLGPCLGWDSWSHHTSEGWCVEGASMWEVHVQRVVTIHADECRMPWARLPRAQVLSPDAPKVAGLAPPAALTFAGRLGALWGHCV